jgi:chloride channel 3/4/5
MTSRTSSFSVPAQRPSVSNRLSFAVSLAEQGEEDIAPQGAAAQIDEEIEEIKRYEDFTTIDWVQDAAREQARRNAQKRANANFLENGGRAGWRYKIWQSYDAGQGWIVVTLIGAAIGLNAAFLNIITEWLSDVKLGYCRTAFYLNESFCCWGEDNGCDNWVRWSGFMPFNFAIYVLFAVSTKGSSSTN